MDALPILSVRNLTKLFGRPDGRDRLLPGCREVSFDLFPGESIGLVGESGSGKTTVARCLTRLLDPDTGEIFVLGRDFGAMASRGLRRFRHHIQMVFQKPETSLNPRMTIAQFVSEVFRNFDTVERGREHRRLLELAQSVGLREEYLDRYPHQLSGGEKQRVGLMRALACDPSVIVLDEPTSALDVSVQAQVLGTLRDIQEQTSVSFILISHDIAVVRHMCSRILVMYLGRIIEESSTEELFVSPRHPYTKALFDAVPRLHAVSRRRVVLTGEATTYNVRKSACPLLPRCSVAMDACERMPPTIDVGPEHKVRCWLAEEEHGNRAEDQVGGVGDRSLQSSP